MKCPKCGKELANDSCYCEYCGTNISQNKPNQPISISFWYLPYVVLLIICLANILCYEIFWAHAWYPDSPHFDIDAWLAVPILSLLITIGCIVIVIKKRQSVFHVIAPVLIVGLNIALVGFVSSKDNDYVQRTVVHLDFTKDSENAFSFSGFGYGNQWEYEAEEQDIASIFNNSGSTYKAIFSHHIVPDYSYMIEKVNRFLGVVVIVEIAICLLSILLVMIKSSERIE